MYILRRRKKWSRGGGVGKDIEHFEMIIWVEIHQIMALTQELEFNSCLNLPRFMQLGLGFV
jgi:hypothetical protein